MTFLRHPETIHILAPVPPYHPLDDAQDRLHQVLADYLEAAESGTAPDPATLLAMHPEVAADLAEFMTVVEQVDRYVTGLRLPSGRPPMDTLLESFGDYELLAEVGRGGMGIVFKAHQKSLNRCVALKVIRGHAVNSPQDSRRFRAEAEAAAHLDHPHIVPIYEIGEHNGRPFFSMKLFEGGSLAGYAPQLTVKPHRTAELVSTIARAVHHAHQRGILHRDLKPSNILLDAEGRPHVADFGLAKWLHVDQAQTQTGDILGTPAYMAPEQTMSEPGSARGSAATTAGDVYGLGAILYTLLTGKPPFCGLLPLDILLAVRDQEPQNPSKFNPSIDRDLATICLKCLEKNPGRRYPSALAFAEDLGRWQAGEPILARPVGAWDRTRRWFRRNPLVATMTGAVSSMAVCGVAILAISYVVVSREHDTSEAYRLRAERQAAQLRERLYASQISLGFKHLRQGELDETQKVLDEFRHEDDLKGFEWHWLAGAASSQPREITQYTGHQQIVYDAIFSPDGLTAATCGADRTIQLWDPTTGTNRKTLRPVPKPNPVDGSADENCVRFSPDGRQLASGCEDGTVRLWNLKHETWQALRPAHRGEVLALDFSKDGRWLVTASADQIVRVWDMNAPGTYADFTRHMGPVTSAAFSPNGREVASSDKHGGIQVWDRETQVVRFSANPGGSQLCITYSRDGSLMASGGQTGAVNLWRTDAYEPVYLQKRPTGTIRCVDFSSDGTRLVCGDDEGAIVVWRIPEGDVEWHFNARQGRIWSACFAPDSRQLLTAGEDSTSKIWELPSQAHAVGWIGNSVQKTRHVAFSTRGTALAVSLQDGTVMLSDAHTPGLSSTLPIDCGDLTPPVFSADGSQLAVVGRSGRIARWDLDRKCELSSFDPPAFSPAGPIWQTYAIRLAYDISGRLIALRSDGRMWICDKEHWREQFPPCRSSAAPPLLSPLADYDAILMCDVEQSVVKLWRPRENKVIRQFSCPAHIVAGCSFDEKELAFGHRQGNITLRRLFSENDRRLLIGHHRQVTSLAFSPDGKTLASASSDGAVRLWHVATGEEFFLLEDLHREVYSLSFSKDGRFLATAGDRSINGKSVAVHDSRPAAAPVAARSGNLTRTAAR